MKSLDDKLSDDEREAFYSLDSDRAKGVMLGSIIENHLTALLKAAMKNDTVVANELFQPSGPLGNFGTKIRLAYMLGLIAPATYKDLLAVNRIRNLFAHNLSVKSFEDQRLTAWVKNMHVYPHLVALRDKPSEGRFGEFLSYILEGALETTRDAYRECLRLYIHVLIDSREKIEARLSETDPPPSSPEKSG